MAFAAKARAQETKQLTRKASILHTYRTLSYFLARNIFFKMLTLKAENKLHHINTSLLHQDSKEVQNNYCKL